jgi:hypothetical protein
VGTRAALSDGRWSLFALQAGALLVVLAALPYPLFQLDRYTFAKELVLLMAALTATVCCVANARSLSIAMADVLVGGFLALSLVSALLADNRWLAARAFGVSLAGAALFWTARAVARAGQGGGPGGLRPFSARGGGPPPPARGTDCSPRWRPPWCSRPRPA